MDVEMVERLVKQLQLESLREKIPFNEKNDFGVTITAYTHKLWRQFVSSTDFVYFLL